MYFYPHIAVLYIPSTKSAKIDIKTKFTILFCYQPEEILMRTHIPPWREEFKRSQVLTHYKAYKGLIRSDLKLDYVIICRTPNRRVGKVTYVN